MPRKSRRGGRREGTPGTSYAQRTDLQAQKPPVAKFTGQDYGVAKAQADAQAAVPVAAPPGAPGPSAPSPALGPGPGQLGGLLDPTAHPDRPITTGMPFGPGAGPEALTRPDPDAAAIDKLRVLYRNTGSPALGRLLEAWEDD